MPAALTTPSRRSQGRGTPRRTPRAAGTPGNDTRDRQGLARGSPKGFLYLSRSPSVSPLSHIRPFTHYLSLLVCSFLYRERNGCPSAASCSLVVEVSEFIASRGESKALVRHFVFVDRGTFVCASSREGRG